ncbi:MAG: mechanosensitive ion channel family protein [Bacteroidales bacterium]|nr:mechanosensitive ion channel family protein [Bacteroidales bacterium]
MIGKYLNLIQRIGVNSNLPEDIAFNLAQIIATITLLILSFALFYLGKYLIVKIVGNIIKKSENKYDDYLLNYNFGTRMAFLIPIYMVRAYIEMTAPEFTAFDNFIIILTKVCEIITYIGIIMSLVDSFQAMYNTRDVSKTRPIKGVVQVIKIILVIACILLVIAAFTQRDIKTILLGLGTLSAIMMLVFKDSILGFVGGIQLTTNDMVRIGDWIVKGDADGNVIDIGLTTVKVQNWDNTISTIPTYSLVTDPFTNWRGMSDSGGRRIARSVIIDADTVKFCTPEMLQRFKKYQLVAKYITDTENDIAKFNEENGIDTSSLVNGRRQTNIGIFRAYLVEYLMNNPNVNKDMTVLVRQQNPVETGIPIQIYCFSKNKDWVPYEAIQSDIFDHIFAVIPEFDLRVYQKPSSYSIENATNGLKARRD